MPALFPLGRVTCKIADIQLAAHFEWPGFNSSAIPDNNIC